MEKLAPNQEELKINSERSPNLVSSRKSSGEFYDGKDFQEYVDKHRQNLAKENFSTLQRFDIMNNYFEKRKDNFEVSFIKGDKCSYGLYKRGNLCFNTLPIKIDNLEDADSFIAMCEKIQGPGKVFFITELSAARNDVLAGESHSFVLITEFDSNKEGLNFHIINPNKSLSPNQSLLARSIMLNIEKALKMHKGSINDVTNPVYYIKSRMENIKSGSCRLFTIETMEQIERTSRNRGSDNLKTLLDIKTEKGLFSTTDYFDIVKTPEEILLKYAIRNDNNVYDIRKNENIIADKKLYTEQLSKFLTMTSQTNTIRHFDQKIAKLNKKALIDQGKLKTSTIENKEILNDLEKLKKMKTINLK